MVCESEQSIQSDHSPCVVADHEDILYCLIDPDLIDTRTGELKNKAFSKSTLRETQLSVVRKPYSSAGEILSKVVEPQLEKIATRTFCGVLVARADEIRAIRSKSPQDVCVVDYGLVGFASHAHLGFCCSIASSSKSVQEAVRSNLVETFRTKGIQILEHVF